MTTTARRPAARPVGRPTRLNRSLIEAIVVQVRTLGIRGVNAAQALGVHPQVYYRWTQDGQHEDGKPMNRELWLSTEEAFRQWEIERLEEVSRHAKSDPKSAQWLLERRAPDDYGRSTRIAVSGEVQVKPIIDPSKYTVEQLQALRDLLAIGAPDPSLLPKDGAPAIEMIGASIDGVVLREEDV